MSSDSFPQEELYELAFSLWEKREEDRKKELLNRVLRYNYGYPSFYDRGYEISPGILLDNSGRTRLSNIFGYIGGVYAAGNKEFALKLAEDIFNNLQRVGSTEFIPGTKVPQEIAFLGDDGTLNGFSVLWYRAREFSDYQDLENQKREISTRPRGGILKDPDNPDKVLIKESWDPKTEKRRYFFYSFNYNGGLLYHGPGGGEVFSCTLSPCLWGIHT